MDLGQQVNRLLVAIIHIHHRHLLLFLSPTAGGHRVKRDSRQWNS